MGLVLLSPIWGVVLGFVLGALLKERWRRPVLVVALLLPLLAYTLDLLSAQPSEPSFLSWWFAGLFVVGPVLALAALLTFGGYLGGAYLARHDAH